MFLLRFFFGNFNKLYGFKRAKVDHYFPIHTDSNYRAASFESIVRDMSLENSGFMKERVKASNPIYLEDIVDVINSQIANVSKYCGMTIPIRKKATMTISRKEILPLATVQIRF